MQQEFIINLEVKDPPSFGGVNRQSSVICPSPLYICREHSTNQLLFMQNKPNFPKSQMNVNPYNTTDYENKCNWTIGQNKPNSNPNKPNSPPILKISVLNFDNLYKILTTYEISF